MRNTDDLLATRTVAVRFPAGEIQYWLTTRVFSIGDIVERDGREYTVSDVAGTPETGREPRITLEAGPNPATPSDLAKRDRRAWNLPAANEAPAA